MEKFIREGTAEYIEAPKSRGMLVTIETSHTELPSASLTALMVEMTQALQDAGMNAKWAAYHCDVCASHNPKYPIHYEIKRA